MNKYVTPELEHIGTLVFPAFEKTELRRLQIICTLLLDEVNKLRKEVNQLKEQGAELDTRTIGMVRLGS